MLVACETPIERAETVDSGMRRADIFDGERSKTREPVLTRLVFGGELFGFVIIPSRTGVQQNDQAHEKSL